MLPSVAVGGSESASIRAFVAESFCRSFGLFRSIHWSKWRLTLWADICCPHPAGHGINRMADLRRNDDALTLLLARRFCEAASRTEKAFLAGVTVSSASFRERLCGVDIVFLFFFWFAKHCSKLNVKDSFVVLGIGENECREKGMNQDLAMYYSWYVVANCEVHLPEVCILPKPLDIVHRRLDPFTLNGSNCNSKKIKYSSWII